MNTRRHIVKSISSILIGSTFLFSVVPQLVYAAEVAELQTGNGVIESSQASISTPEITVIEIAETDHSMTVNKGEIKEALTSMPGLISISDQVELTKDVDSAVIASTEEIVVDIPKDPEDGVAISVDGLSVEIELPNADEAKNAKRIGSGVVAYPGKDGSANAVQADTDGGVRMLTVIDNAQAPTSYEYTVTVPDGGYIELTTEGGALIVDSNKQPVIVIDAPWAKDATGRSIESWFTTDGSMLIQHVAHADNINVVYPVTADPWVKKWYGYVYELNRKQTNDVMFGLGFSAAGLAGVPDFMLTKIMAAGMGATAAYANWVYNRGGCLKVTITSIGPMPTGWTSHYYGGNCR